MSGNKATEGTIVIERGDVVDVQNLLHTNCAFLIIINKIIKS